MKKLILASCLFCTSLWVSSIYAASCHFTITLNNVWGNYPQWTIIITDASGSSIYEAVGGPQLTYDGKTVKKEGVVLYADVNDCTNSTELGFFGHYGLTDYSSMPMGNMAEANPDGAGSGDGSGAALNAGSSLNTMGGATNVLTGISKCVGDLQKTTEKDGVYINLTLGNPSNPGDFFFGTGSSWQNSWSKKELGVVCNNPDGQL